MPLQVFLIAGLFADEDNCGVASAFSKHGLSRLLIQIATGARFGRLP
jgi:hypothetical protein